MIFWCCAGFGFDEPLLEELTSKNIRHTLAGVLRYVLDPKGSHIGMGDKALAGIVFAKRLGSKAYQTKCHILAMHNCVHKDLIAAAEAFDPVHMKAPEDFSATDRTDNKLIAALTLAHALGPSPAQVPPRALVLCVLPLQFQRFCLNPRVRVLLWDCSTGVHVRRVGACILGCGVVRSV